MKQLALETSFWSKISSKCPVSIPLWDQVRIRIRQGGGGCPYLKFFKLSGTTFTFRKIFKTDAKIRNLQKSRKDHKNDKIGENAEFDA